jgi:hypothetical protein
MTDKAVTFGATDGFGTIAGWELQSSSGQLGYDRATALNATGDNEAVQLFNAKTEVSATYKCVSNTNTIPADLGAIVNGYVLTGIDINTTAEDYATMTLTGHNHAANAHASGLRTCTHGITLAACFGATDFLGGTAGDAGDAAAPQSGSISIKCDHVDENDATGGHFCGENHNAVIEAKTTWLGSPAVTAAKGWDVTSTPDDGNTENTGFLKTEVSGVKNMDMTAGA